MLRRFLSFVTMSPKELANSPLDNNAPLFAERISITTFRCGENRFNLAYFRHTGQSSEIAQLLFLVSVRIRSVNPPSASEVQA